MIPQVFTAAGVFISVIGKGFGSELGYLNRPAGVKLDRKTRVYVSDSLNHRIQVFSSVGVPLRVFGGEGYEPGLFRLPLGLDVSSSGKRVFVADWYVTARFRHQEPTRTKRAIPRHRLRLCC